MDARFIAASEGPQHMPAPTLTEVAVAGRSNCGKSSLINALTHRKKLARTSRTPGRTRQIVFFSISTPQCPTFYLVDLPGYGYAKVSKAQKASWGRFINQYIDSRETLRIMLLLMDIRRDPSAEEQDILRWVQKLDIPALVVLTKSDKLSKNKRYPRLMAIKKELNLDSAPLACSINIPQSITELRRALFQAINAVKEPR